MTGSSSVQAYSGGPMTVPQKRGPQERRFANVSARLDAMIAAVSDQDLTGSSDLDPRIQTEFRHALDHVRQTASAVRQWFEVRARSADPYAILPVLATERVHRMTEFARELSFDLENMDVTVETAGLEDLYQTLGELHRLLGVICKPRQ